MRAARSIPAFVNPASGSADVARTALARHDAFAVHAIEPQAMTRALEAVVAEGADRVLVAGGDGTIATAAATLMPAGVELAILPGGTLNHFARDLGISSVASEALECALEGTSRPVDVGDVNGRIFLNTSSVGAYVQFVRLREYLEPRLGYRIASAVAAFRVLFGVRQMAVALDIDGERRVYRTPLVFIGVGEREVQLPALGNRVHDGRRGLHVIAVRSRSRARLLALALNAVARGVKSAAETPELDSFVVDRCTITHRSNGLVAVDGEIVPLGSTLEYEIRKDALRVVCP